MAMKATGIVRGIDHLGRIVLPVDVRRKRGIERKDELEIYVDGEYVILQKHRPGCVFCGAQEGLGEFRGKVVCEGCRVEIGALNGHATD